MKNIAKFVIASSSILMSMAFVSCNDIFDELAVNPNQQDVSSFYNNSDNINKGIIGIYSYISTPRCMGINGSRLLVTRGDETSDNSDYGVPGQYCVSLTSSYYTLVEPFELFYTAASQACQMIEVIPGVDFADEELKNAYLGEAYFLRAFSHWFLFLNFRNIPLMDKFPENSKDYRPQSAPEDTWDFIIEDLKKAKDLLPPKGYWSKDNMGRVTSASAAALLGKAYLYRSGIEKYYGNSSTTYYDEAAACFDEIIRGVHGDYKLVDNYNDNFAVATENNDESIFEIQFLGDVNNTGFNPGFTDSGCFRDPRGVWAPSFISASVTRSHVIHQWVYDAFVNSKDVNGYTDSRMFGTLLFDDTASEINAKPGDEVIIFDGKKFNEYYTPKNDNGNVVKGFGLISAQAGKYKSACRKGLDWTLPTVNPGNDVWMGNYRANGMNYTYIRYADVLLMYAEALVSGAQKLTLSAEQAVNMVRTRPSVNLPEVSSVDMDVIEKERILELTCEGHRFYDLLRWGKVATRFHELEASDPNFKQYTSSEYLGFVEGKNEWLPIPIDEVEGNPYITENNPGWN